jgi:hypothetical protein
MKTWFTDYPGRWISLFAVGFEVRSIFYPLNAGDLALTGRSEFREAHARLCAWDLWAQFHLRKYLGALTNDHATGASKSCHFWSHVLADVVVIRQALPSRTLALSGAVRPGSTPTPLRRLILVVVVEQLAGLVVHEDVEDSEEKTRIRQAGETGVIRDQKALRFVVERDVCRIRRRKWRFLRPRRT